MSAGSVSCSTCAFIAQDWPSLRSHYASAHEYCLLHDCKYCDHFFMSTKDRKEHLVSAHNFIQCKCSRVFRYQGRLDLHLKLEHGVNSEKPPTGNYGDLKTLTDEYLQKIREILTQEKCENLGGLHSSLQQFISSESSGSLGQDSQMAVLAFVMHAAEIAITSPRAPSLPHADAASVSPQSGQSTVPKAHVNPPVISTPRTIFVTETVEREGMKRPMSQVEKAPKKKRKGGKEPPAEVSKVQEESAECQIMHQFQCEFCVEKFASRAEAATHEYHHHRSQQCLESPSTIHCTVRDCPELFSEPSELVTHLRIAHNDT